MAKKDPRIDAYIGKAPDFAKPILLKLRKAAHAGCPQVEEGIKWSVPAYLHNGILCMTAGFKQHCMLVFWNNAALKKALKEKGDSGELLGKLRRIKKAADLPSDAALKQLVKQAAALGSAGVKPVRPKKSKAAKAEVPADLKAALTKNKKAQAGWAALSPSKRRDYIDWLNEAKRAETRQKRLATAIGWIAQGKGRNWKYER